MCSTFRQVSFKAQIMTELVHVSSWYICRSKESGRIRLLVKATVELLSISHFYQQGIFCDLSLFWRTESFRLWGMYRILSYCSEVRCVHGSSHLRDAGEFMSKNRETRENHIFLPVQKGIGRHPSTWKRVCTKISKTMITLWTLHEKIRSSGLYKIEGPFQREFAFALYQFGFVEMLYYGRSFVFRRPLIWYLSQCSNDFGWSPLLARLNRTKKETLRLTQRLESHFATALTVS